MSIDTRKYAQELYDLAVHENKLDLYLNEIEKLNDALNVDSELSEYFNSSKYSSSDKKTKVKNLKINSEVLSTFFVMVDAINKSHVELQLIHDFLVHYYSFEKKLFGTVYSVRVLSSKQIKDIEKAISSQLGRDVKLENKLDAELIGGVKVVVNNNIWDGSYKSKIKDLKKDLLTTDEELKANSKELSKQISAHIDTYEKNNVSIESSDGIGYVTSVADGIINISGVYKAMASELLEIGDARAMVMNLEEENIGAVLLTNEEGVAAKASIINGVAILQ